MELHLAAMKMKQFRFLGNPFAKIKIENKKRNYFIQTLFLDTIQKQIN